MSINEKVASLLALCCLICVSHQTGMETTEIQQISSSRHSAEYDQTTTESSIFSNPTPLTSMPNETTSVTPLASHTVNVVKTAEQPDFRFSTLTDKYDLESPYRSSNDWKGDTEQSVDIWTSYRTTSVTTNPRISGYDDALMVTSNQDVPDQSASALYWVGDAYGNTKHYSQYPADEDSIVNEASSERQLTFVTDRQFLPSSTEVVIGDVTRADYRTESVTTDRNVYTETSAGNSVDAETTTAFPNNLASTRRGLSDPEFTVEPTSHSSDQPTTEMTTAWTDNAFLVSSEYGFSTSTFVASTSGSYDEYSDEISTTLDIEENKSELTSIQIQDTSHYFYQTSPSEVNKQELGTSVSSDPVTFPDPCAGVLCTYGAVCHDGLCRCPPSCRHEVAPVCASNGRTYMSECDMRAHMCVERITLVVIASGACLQTPYNGLCAGVVCRYGATCINGDCVCPNACPPVFSPVCGNDGKTYSSECLLKTTACLQKPQLRLRYRVACDDVSPIIDVVIQESKEEDVFLDDVSLLVIYVCIGALVSVTLIVVFIVVVVNKRRLSLSNKYDDVTPLTKSAMRTSSSSSHHSQHQPHHQYQQQQRGASWITIEPRPQHSPPSPCSTPITPQSGFTFTNDKLTNSQHKQTIPVRSPISSTDTSVVEMAPEDDVTIEMPDLGVSTARRADGVKRNAPGRRHTSVTESGVYEVAPEEAVILDDVFQNDDQIVTRL